MLRLILLLLLLPLLAACASTASRNDARWQSYAQITAASAEAQRQSAAEQSAQFNALAAACPVGDGTCVVAVAGFKALAQAGGTAQPAATIPAPPLERDFASKARDLLAGVSPLASALAGAAVSYRQSDNALRTAEAQYGFLSNTVGAMATVAESAQPNISVGGNWGDTYGNDYTGGDRTQTDIGGDSIGGDRIADSTIGDGNRADSPDIDDSYNGGDCTSAPGGNSGNGTTGTVGAGGASTGCQAGNGGGG
jgi:hypothetical protein